MTKQAYVVRSGGQHFGDYDGTFLTNIAGLSKNGKVSIQYTLQLLKELVDSGLVNLSRHPFKNSPFRRAKETATILAEGQLCETVERLGPMHESSWNFLRDNFPDAVWCNIGKLFENQAVGLLHIEGESLFKAIIESISMIEPGETVVLVTHSRLIEAAMAIASEWKPPESEVKEGDIIVFNFDDDNNFIADNPSTIFGHLRPSPEE
ncbi:MAG: histidine phosphatase family protein [Candidatus Pacebacteria bacterium]|nr:histidine phosphatase family protein [Candidatus Paceibacterota bacterium]